MVEPETAGNPMNAEKWVRSSLQHLSEKLKDQGHEACPKTVGQLLKDLKYSLKANVKRRAGSQHPDRNTQFGYIEAQKQLFLADCQFGWQKEGVDWQFQERRSVLVLGSRSRQRP
jgi:hypothetical protein